MGFVSSLGQKPAVNPFLVGDRIYLRALYETDAWGPYPTWFNDEETCRGNSHHVYPYTPEQALEYIRHANQSRQDLVLAIVRKEDDQHIGNIALHHISPVYRSAEYAIVIGEKVDRGKGYSKEAGRILFNHGFFTLNLHRIACGTFADNLPMVRLAAYLCMQVEGRRREAAYKDGSYIDVIEFGVLEREYAAKHRAK